MQDVESCKVQNSARSKIMQSDAKWKIVQSARICKMQIYAKCKCMQGVNYLIHYANYKIMKSVSQHQLAFFQLAFEAC